MTIKNGKMNVGSDTMGKFFTNDSPYRTRFIDHSQAEYIIPLLILALLIFMVVFYGKKIIPDSKNDRIIRYSIGAFFIILYLSHYILRFNIYGFDTLILPFQLCSMSMFLAIILIYTRNKTVFAFVLYTGVLGGIISLLVPVIGYNSVYYRYYQYYLAHSILILTPIYFLVVYNYYPTKKDTVNAFLILQGLAVFMGIFVNPDKVDKFPMIAKFGGIPYYIILVEIAGVSLYYLMYKVTRVIFNFYHRKNEKEYKIA